MNRDTLFRVMVVALVGACLAGCMGPQGSSIEDKRVEVLAMRDQTIQELNQREPKTVRELALAAGYAVFSDFGTQFLIVSSGTGYGVAVDNGTHRRTYMRTAGLGAGLGFGVHQYRVVLVFRTENALAQFLAVGWEFGGSGSASARADDVGTTNAFAASVSQDVTVYQLTENGVMLGASMSGAKFWVDDELNQ